MNPAAAIALRQALRARLLADAQLVTLLGGARVFDEAPRGTPAPYVLVGSERLRDWSTMTESGSECQLGVDVVSEHRGAAEALAIAARIAAIVETAPPVLSGHTLVLLRLRETQTRREQNGRFARVSLLLRALIETP